MFVLYVVVEHYSPKPISWETSLLTNDKNPYGCYILDERLTDLFPASDKSFLSLYEMKDSTDQILILAPNLEMDRLDIETLLDKVDQGYSALLGSFYISQKLLDTLGLETIYRPFDQIRNDTIDIFTDTDTLHYSSALFKTWLVLKDSSWVVHARQEKPVLASRPWGKGYITVSASPLVFTNYAILQDETLAEMALNTLGYQPIHNTLFYHTGKPQNTSTFRYIVTEKALRWALYLSLALIAFLLVIDSQRRQTMIPIIRPPINTTVDFIKTLAALFHREGNHKKAAEKLAGYFLHDLQKRFVIHPEFDESYYSFIAKKTNSEKARIIKLFEQIQSIRAARSINEDQLKNFHKDLNEISDNYAKRIV
jgi:hypothetical protein